MESRDGKKYTIGLLYISLFFLLNTDADHFSSPFASLVSCLETDVAEVRRQKIWEVVKNDDYKVNNLLDDEYEPRDRRSILKDACRMVGEHLPYSLVNYNCEHFVMELRYGKAESRQVRVPWFSSLVKGDVP